MYRTVQVLSGLVVSALVIGVSCAAAPQERGNILNTEMMALVRGGTGATCQYVVNKNCMVGVNCLESAATGCDGSCGGGCSKNKREDYAIDVPNGYILTPDHAPGGCGVFVEDATCANFGGVCICMGGTPGTTPCLQWGYIIGDECN